jgi:serine/threonine-protein kinase
VLEGSVRKADNRLRVTAQLIQVSTGFHLWSGTFDTEMDDIFAIQEDISRSVVNTLRVKLGLNDHETLVRRHTDNLEAYNAYLHGLFQWNMGSEPALRRAIELFHKAIHCDAEYALAYAGLADAYNRLGYYNYLPPAEGFTRGKQAALQALSLNPELPAAHASVAYAAMHHDWDWTQAHASYKRSLELDPQSGTARRWNALYLAVTGDLDGALAEAIHARGLDPMSPIMHSGVGRHHYFRGEFASGIQEQENALQLYDSFIPALTVRAQIFMQMGRLDDAHRDLARAVELSQENPVQLSLLGHCHGLAGRRAEAEAVVGRLEEHRKTRFVSSYCSAVAYVGMGELDQAINHLEAALDERSNWLVYVGVDPLFRPLRGHPGLSRILEHTGLTQRPSPTHAADSLQTGNGDGLTSQPVF